MFSQKSQHSEFRAGSFSKSNLLLGVLPKVSCIVKIVLFKVTIKLKVYIYICIKYMYIFKMKKKYIYDLGNICKNYAF